MALNIKNPEVELLASEVAKMTGESKTEAIRKALLERKQHLASHVIYDDRRARLLRFFERDVWPNIPKKVLGRRVSKKKRESILGYGPKGI